jgi:tetratricopeptide (TPR) repeat protein
MVFFSLDGKSGIEKFKSLLSRNIDIDIRNSPDGDRLTIQYAVLAVCEQIGVPYNFKKSIELTNSKCQKYISRVRMQNIVAYKAIDRIVQPHGLSCDFDDEGLFLVEKGRTRTPGENVVTEKTTNETNVQLEDKNNQTYKVTFRPKGVFSPTNAGELLKTFNNCIQYRVETHHFRTKVKNGVLYGYILTDSNAEAKAIELMMEKSDDLEFIKAENVNDKKLAEHYASEQENLNDFNSSSGQSDKTILKNDDGRSKGKWSFSGGGHGVKFTAPSDGCTLKAVRLYGSRYGEYEAPDEDFDVWICDENFNVIKNFRFPYSLFAKRGYATWVTLKVDDVKVPKEFAICVAFDPHQTKGIYVYHDAKTSRHSYQGIPPEMQPFKDGDWLIRAVIEKPEPQTKSVSRADKMQAENIASQGWKLWRQRKLAEAEDKFKQAVDKDPANANTWNGLGWSQQNQGKKQNARYSFEKCLQIEPKHAAALNGLGWIAKGEGETDDAIEYWEKAVNASNGTATASLSGLAQTYLELGQYDKATKYYQKWLNVEPSNQEAKEGLRKARANK